MVMSDTDNGPEETNQCMCSFRDAFADAFWDVLDDCSFDSFVQELLINAIGGGLSKALSAYFKAAQGATSSAIDIFPTSRPERRLAVPVVRYRKGLTVCRRPKPGQLQFQSMLERRAAMLTMALSSLRVP